MATVYLASMVVMGVLAIGVGLWAARGRQWESYTPASAAERGGTLSELAGDGRTWIVAFIIVALGVTGVTIAALGGGSTTLVYGVAGALVATFLVVGTYARGRSLGHPHAHSVGEAVAVLGSVFVLTVVGWLVTSFGA
ncbi:hypothetical protein ACKVMT_17220 [Halobacteriales archaeon Cl-PHB]